MKQILEKYDYKLPKAVSNQKMNEYIKKIYKKAKINEEIITTITKGGKVVSDKTKKFNLVSSHTSRRSFATNQYLRGVPSRLIMMITSHKTETIFLKYIKVTAQEESNRLKDMWKI